MCCLIAAKSTSRPFPPASRTLSTLASASSPTSTGIGCSYLSEQKSNSAGHKRRRTGYELRTAMAAAPGRLAARSRSRINPRKHDCYSRFEVQPIVGSALSDVAAFVSQCYNAEAEKSDGRKLDRESAFSVERRLRWLLIDNPAASGRHTPFGYCLRDEEGVIRGTRSMFSGLLLRRGQTTSRLVFRHVSGGSRCPLYGFLSCLKSV